MRGGWNTRHTWFGSRLSNLRPISRIKGISKKFTTQRPKKTPRLHLPRLPQTMRRLTNHLFQKMPVPLMKLQTALAKRHGAKKIAIPLSTVKEASIRQSRSVSFHQRNCAVQHSLCRSQTRNRPGCLYMQLWRLLFGRRMKSPTCHHFFNLARLESRISLECFQPEATQRRLGRLVICMQET